MNSPGTHVSTVKRIMSAILPKFGTDRKVQYELNKIARRLRKNNSNLYSPLSGKVEHYFSEAIYKLMMDLDYFKPALDTSVGIEDEHQLEQFQIMLLNRLLHSKSITLDMLTFESIRDEITKISGKGLNDIQNVFKVRFAALTSLKTTNIHHSYQIVYKLWMLSTFNYNKLLSNLQKKKRNGTMTFTSCFGDIILEDLKDLYFLCAGFKPDKSGMKMLELITSIRNDSPPDEQGILSHFAGVQEFLETDVPAEVLGDIIRYSSMDPYIELREQEIDISFMGKIQSVILARFKSLRNTYQKEAAEKIYRSLIKQLFNTPPLYTLEGYSSQISSVLSSNDFTGLKYITALRLVKTFSSVFYEAEMMEVFLEFLDKVDFISPKYRISVENSFRSCNELAGSIMKFENDLSDPQLSKLLPILGHCTQGTVKNEHRKQMENTIDGINKLAANIIDAGTSGLYSLMQTGLKSLEDIRAKNSEIVENSRFMRDNEQEFLQTLENSTGKLFQFMEIMTHFSINKEQFKQWKDNVKKGVIKYG